MLRANTLYENRNETGDVTFIVESERILAHRNVLAAVSEKYKAQFYGLQPDEGDIEVNGISAATFKEFLKFFYREKVELSPENIGEVLYLAKQSLVDEFVGKCVEFLKRKMTIDNLCSIYQLAITYDIEKLKDLCEQKISNDTKALFATEDFFDCDRETLGEILKLGSFSCSEAEVFDACISWARADCVKNQIDGSNAANLRAALGIVITQLRFSSMSLDEFVDRQKKLSGFFSAEECLEIMNMIKMKRCPPKIFSHARRYKSHSFLQCNLVSEKLESEFQHNGFESLDIRCAKPIHWHGFVIDSDKINKADVTIKIGPDVKHPQILLRKAIDETTILLCSPIEINSPNETLRLIFESLDLNRLKFHQYKFMDKVETNNISFSIRNHFHQQSVISRILFRSQ